MSAEAGAVLAGLGDAALSALDEAVIAHDARGCVRLANRAAARLFGAPSVEELEGASIEERWRRLDARDPSGGAAPELPGGRALAGEPEAQIEARVGERRLLIKAHAAPGGVAVNIFYDVTAQRRAEEESARTARDAAAALRARDDVLAIVSHDLRNPLHAILMSAGSLSRVAVPEAVAARIRAPAARVERAALRMNRLIADLVDSALLEAGGLPLEPAAHGVGGLIDEALERVRPLIDESRLRVERRVPEVIGALRGDRGRVLQVLSTLLAEAVKFTPEGGALGVRAEERDGEIGIAVEDTGPGLAPGERAHLFERYCHGGAQVFQGVGLGLHLAKQLVEAQGGRVWVESEPGRGSAFWFALPAV